MAETTGKLPFMQFYVSDWLSDTAMLSPATKGIWIDMLALMHIKKTGTITGTPEKLARACRCSISEMEYAIHEMKSENVADIEACYGNVTEEYSITCRRMKRTENERVRARESMQKKRALQKCYEDVTPYISDTESDTDTLPDGSVLNAHTHAKEQPDDGYPHSIDAVLEIAKSVQVGLPCTKEQAEAYFTWRVASDWFDANNNKIKAKAIPYDLKRWLLRDQNENRKAKGQYRDGKSISNNPADYGEADAI